MAPEVFMKSNTEGHGRAADIWSIGCVIIEMASGKVCFYCQMMFLRANDCIYVYYRDLGMNMIQIIKSCSKWVWVSRLQYQTH